MKSLKWLGLAWRLTKMGAEATIKAAKAADQKLGDKADALDAKLFVKKEEPKI